MNPAERIQNRVNIADNAFRHSDLKEELLLDFHGHFSSLKT